MRRPVRAQTDLFVEGIRPIEIAGADRQKALALLQALLSEATMMKKAAWQQNNSGEGAINEQDHR